MNIDDYSFHDSTILTVTEHTDNQTVDYLIDFPTDWENNKFEKRTLRFTDVITHNIEEIPFAGQPAIIEIVNHGLIEKIFGTGKNQIKADRQKIEIKTNAGNRLIEFSNCEFFK
jgi:hypothetical protein